MNTMTKTALIALIATGTLGAVTLSASALGGPRGGMGHGGFGMGRVMQMTFEDLDADGSGQITSADLLANARARFDKADANTDGQLEAQEIQAMIKQRMKARAEARAEAGHERAPDWAARAGKRVDWIVGKMLKRKDTDASGALSFDEIAPDPARLDRMIARFDTDGDKALSPAEFDAARKAFAMRGKGRHGCDK